jgi:hypothetical protein
VADLRLRFSTRRMSKKEILNSVSILRYFPIPLHQYIQSMQNISLGRIAIQSFYIEPGWLAIHTVSK